jgi:predicted nucleic acid-binding Zn finger protein
MQVENMGDHPLRFLVTSEKRADVKHLVDLGENYPFGKCSCEQFTFRVQPEIDKGHTVNVAFRCKHILAAREKLTDDVVARLKTNDGGGA